MIYRSKKANNIFDSKLDKLFQRIPALGKLVTTLFGALELPLLDLFHLIDKIFKINTAELVGSQIFKGRWGSKVVPLNVNFMPETKFLPTEEIMSIIERSGVVGVAWCYCRTRALQRGEKTCDHPLYTCIHVGLGKSLYDIPSKSMNLKKVSKEEIKELLYDAEQRGLVHQIIFFGNPQFYYVICNCCPCCCEVMKNFLHSGSPQMVKSEFIAVTDPNKCIDCGKCEQWCYFGARTMKKGKLNFDPVKCFGCGVCVPKCPKSAIGLVRKN
ncbi:MAG: 4Fe-4S dicluster domain-containing protein [Promethearchaeota archaeon]|nr:MAG: 4Fe-4S dicluster domain-containing protein [Candidatus Lokiarchaeota archaeon]